MLSFKAAFSGERSALVAILFYTQQLSSRVMTYSINIRAAKAIITGLVIMGAGFSVAHGDDTSSTSSIMKQYEAIKSSEKRQPSQLYTLVEALNQTITANPKDRFAWEALAKIYYDNGYYTYALYSVSEATKLGESTASLQKILLDSSVQVVSSQLEAGYLNGSSDKFVNEYKMTLSQIYGNVHGFNYDESLPTPVVRTKKLTNTKPARARSAQKKERTRKKNAAPRRITKTVIPKQKVPTKRTPVKPSSSAPTDPFGILR